jgi:FMN phosphatase YigB (HAD superfamily)
MDYEMRVQEFTPRKLVIFDIDDTLVHTQTKVHVVKDGQVTKELNSHEFTHYKLQDGEQFDFENFRNAHDFFHNSKPIIPMMNQLKQDIATGNKVVMVTARADFDDRELFLDTFRKYGVDMGKVHVYRAGNMTQKVQTEEKKKIIIRNLLNKGSYTKAIMYDDAEPNLQSFVELKAEYPKTKFYAWHVSLEGEASEYDRTNENQTLEERRKKKRRVRRAAYGPGPFGGYGYYTGYSGDGGGDAGGGGDGGGESINHENFADGKNPQDKGDSKRHGVPTKASVSALRKVAKQGGRKGQLAHWMANMKSGKKK